LEAVTKASGFSRTPGWAVVVKVLMSQPLADLPGKEGLVLEVTLPPGGADDVHRHDAHVFVYMLEGSAVMQVQGGNALAR
jgi:quercetin dioxygenase-like cupin family protein